MARRTNQLDHTEQISGEKFMSINHAMLKKKKQACLANNTRVTDARDTHKKDCYSLTAHEYSNQ